MAPLRGRASLEVVIRPLGYRDAADFWGITDPRLAVLVHSIVGGTPAYRREFVASDVPSGSGDFDSWVLRTVLNSQVPLFREARYLLAEVAEHALGVEGPLREFYVVGSHETADQTLWRTEIGWPIFHTGPDPSSIN
jgi:hypothetical protein